MTQAVAHRIVAGSMFVVIALLSLLPGHAPAAATPENANRIVRENALPGHPPAEWDVEGNGDSSIEGFTTDISINRGERVDFKIRTDASGYDIEIYRIGFYGGKGARRIASMTVPGALAQSQPDCRTDIKTGLVDCGNWRVSASWTVPADVTPGVYVARLVRGDTRGASHVIFVVRDDESRSDILFQTSDTTWQAYNYYGGYSLYLGPWPARRAYKVSYNRPITLRGSLESRESFWVNEYPMIRWLEANGYDVSYTTGVDTARRGYLLKKHRVFMSVGHDEYWSDEQRDNVEAARDAGVHLAFFSGNAIFWRTRWEPSIAPSGEPFRTLVSYKDTHDGTKIDPSPIYTGTWRDARFSSNLGGGRPENALKGSLFVANCCRFDPIVVSSEQGRTRFWRHTELARLEAGRSASVGTRTVGYEWDGDVDNGFRPPGLIRLSATTLDIDSRLLDFGSNFGAGRAMHNLTLYRHRSGSLVFSTGTVQWAWALDATHDDPDAQRAPVDSRLQQATVNILADMSVRPGSPHDSLVVSEPSSDATPPEAMIEEPVELQEFTFHLPVRISGSAVDEGGVAAAVEVSTDGGASWHPANGVAHWTYEFVPRERGYFPILVRAIDDSGNIQPVATSVVIDVSGYSRPARAIALAAAIVALVMLVVLWAMGRRAKRTGRQVAA